MSPLFKKEITLRTILYYLSLVAGLLLFLGYAVFQARFLITGPVVTFFDLPEVVQIQRLVTLEGNAQNIVYLTLNGRQIYTDKSGYFKEALVLENGYTIATLQAHDRYGRTRSYTEKFVYTPAFTSQQ